MCLFNIQKRFEISEHDDNDSFKQGWKVVIKHGNYFFFPYFRMQKNSEETSIVFNSWIEAEPKVLYTYSSTREEYVSGFHIFNNYESARTHRKGLMFFHEYVNLKIIPVYYAQETCLGKTEFQGDTVVANKIYVPK
jgi:hypothetical protein